EYTEWVRRRYASTIAQAFRTAAVSRLRDVSEDDLTVDVIWSDQGEAAIYLTEQGSGGLGQMEMVVHELKQSPDLFHEGLRYALSFCPRHHVATNVLGILDHAVSQSAGDDPQNINKSFMEVRGAKGFQAIAQAKDDLKTSLEQAGLASSRTLVVALVTK